MAGYPTHPGPEESAGFDPGTHIIIMQNDSGGDLTLGKVCEMLFDAGSLNSTLQPTQFTVISNLDDGIYVILLEDIAAGAWGRVCVRGIVDANTVNTPAVGVELSVAATESFDATAVGSKTSAIALETGVGTVTPTKVLFDGFTGFGFRHA